MESFNKIQAVSLAVILFVVLHYSLTLTGNYFANNSEEFMVWLPWLNLTAYFLYLLSGLVASLLSRKHSIFVGLVAGLMSALAAVLIFSVGSELFGVFVTLVSGFVLGGLGGGLSLLFKGRVTNAL